jgi:hypothetical protein
MLEVRPRGCAMCIQNREFFMRTSRFIPIASFVAVAAALAGCSYNRTVSLEPTPAAVVTPAPTVVTPASPAVVTTPGSVIVAPSK